MIYPEEIVRLFKKHGYWKTDLFVFSMMCVSFVVAIVFSDGAALVNALWCGFSIFSDYMACLEKEEHAKTKEKLADAEDKVCVLNHEVERLYFENEALKEALAHADGNGQADPAPTVDGDGRANPAPTVGDKPVGANRRVRPNAYTRPKASARPRRPKPKTNEPKDENQN